MAADPTKPLKKIPRPIVAAPAPFRKSKIFAAVGTAAVLAFHAVPHLFPQINKKIFQYNKQAELPAEFSKIYKETCQKMGVKNPEDGDVFFNLGFTTISAGSFDLPNKAVIGLPRSFMMHDTETLRKSKIKFEDMQVRWDSKAGKALEKALIVKNDHVAFTIAHELAHIKSYDFVYRSLLPASWFYATCRFIIWLLPRAQNAPSKGLKALLTVLLAGVSCAGYSSVSSFMKQRFEITADQKAAECGLVYCDGGISYLKSHLRLNRVIRHMTGVEGAQRFTQSGDDLHNTSHPMLTDRIDKLNKIRKELYDKSNEHE